MNPTTLVTGATGFIGGHLDRRLQQLGHSVITPSSAQLDLRDPAAIDRLFASEQIIRVFHLAAFGVRAEADNVEEVIQVNTVASLTLARAALRHKVEHFIYLGSGFEYQPRESPIDEDAPLGSHNLYGASKAAGWLLMDFLRREEGLPLTTLRPFTVYGPAESRTKLVPYVALHALNREPMQLTAGSQIRDYTYVSDVIDALIAAADSPDSIGRVYNLGDQALTVRSLVERILNIAGAPLSLCEFGAAARTRRDPPYLVADASRAHRELNWHPRVTLEEGLKETLNWYDGRRTQN